MLKTRPSQNNENCAWQYPVSNKQMCESYVSSYAFYICNLACTHVRVTV